jgi:hypothetical protein
VPAAWGGVAQALLLEKLERDGIEDPGRAVVADSYAADRLRAAQADPAEQSGDSCENRIVVGLGNVLMPTVSAESRF